METGDMTKKKERDSSIELLKVCAIFLIVTSHVVQWMSSENAYISSDDFILNLSVSTKEIWRLLLCLFRYFGTLGNDIFFVSSAWFLLNKKETDRRKVLQILADMWTVSVLILIAVFFLRGGAIQTTLVIKALFPNTFACSWYLTCYILFCFLYPHLNFLIEHMEQKTLLRVTLFLLLTYMGFGTLMHSAFFGTAIIWWTALYFMVAYIKRYMKNLTDNVRLNVQLLFVGMVGFISIVCLTNFLGFHIRALSDKNLHWGNICNPFIVLMSISFFNIMRNIKLKSKVVNSISRMSMLIYIIHTNILLCAYYMPLMWDYVYHTYGYEHIFAWVFILAFAVFTVAICAAILYKLTVQKLVLRICKLLYSGVTRKYLRFEEKYLLVKYHR